MDLVTVSRIIAGVAAAVCVVALAVRLDEIMHRPYKRDLSRPQGSRLRGVLYAFTLGMAPWEKESGRKHWVAYLRGVLFHAGAFTAFAVLIASPWLASAPKPVVWVLALLTGAGALAGFAGSALRWLDRNERALSIPDDYFSVILVSLFAAFAFLVLVVYATLPAFYLVSAAMMAYLPFSKIRHCIFFFYAKFFFGANLGQRGLVGHKAGHNANTFSGRGGGAR